MKADIPPPIYSNQPGTWAHSTVVIRYSKTAQQTLDDNDFSAEVRNNITEIISDIPDNPIRQLIDKHAPDSKDWHSYITPLEGKNWLDVPWFFSEHYFYRRIIEAVDYFNTKTDPFRFQKRQGLEKNLPDIRSYATFLEELKGTEKVNTLTETIYFSLWGNQADLSLWPAGSANDPKHSSQQSLKEHLLADDTNQIIKAISRQNSAEIRVDILLDNAGFELISDLGLADSFLSHELAAKVALHVKAHPTFVSDVIEEDIKETVEFLLDAEDKNSRSLGERLESHFNKGNIVIQPHFFWNSPLPMWDLPRDLRREFGKADLIISKGDANYRRLLGDREWDFTLPFNQVVDYLRTPLAAFRTLKAELAVGLDLNQIQDLYNQDPNWMVDGKWGVVHFTKGK